MKKRFVKELKNYCTVLALGAILYILFITGHGIPCPVHMVTGLYCPGCGITRMFYYIIKLDFASAYMQNECAFVLLPFIGFYMIYQSAVFIKTGRRPDNSIISCIAWCLIIIFIVFGILRNI